MPPKGSKGAAAKQRPKEEEREETLQAVVLVDSYETKFRPFTFDRPRCLLPLANTPLIEYTLEFLANAGIKDVLLYCGRQSEQVEEYINSSKWKGALSPFASLTLLQCPASSVGDTLRDLDKRDLITGDFLLVYGDLVSNLAIEPALIKHRLRREKNKNAIMTMIMRDGSLSSSAKASGWPKPIFLIDPTDGRCLHYEEPTRADKFFELDPETLFSHSQLDIRTDLLDCQIDICTPDVLSLWSDNFDYQAPRANFLHGVLKDYELNGKMIYTHVVHSGYAARVRNLAAYDRVSKDVVARRVYPFAPDANLSRGHAYRRLGSGKQSMVYAERGIVLARGSTIGGSSVIGRDTLVGESSDITSSIIGRLCQIGKNVTIRGSSIWDNVSIGDGSVITDSVIAENTTIGRSCNVKVTRIASGMRIADETITEEGSSLASATSDQDHSSDSEVDSGGPFSPASTVRSRRRSSAASSVSSTSTIHSESSDGPPILHSRTDSIGSISMDEVGAGAGAGAAAFATTRASKSAQNALDEAAASIQDGVAKSDAPDTVRLELLAARLTNDASDTFVRDALALGLIRAVWALVDPPSSLSTTPAATAVVDSSKTDTPVPVKEAIARVYDRYGALLRTMGIFDRDSAQKRDQIAALAAVERECRLHHADHDGAPRVLLFVVEKLHRGGVMRHDGAGAGAGNDNDDDDDEERDESEDNVLQDEGVFQWWAADESSGPLRNLVGTYVDLIRDAESDEEEDEEEDDEEEDEED